MKYESDILEMVHENAMIDFKLGFISEARMREFDKLCLPAKTYKEKYAKGNNTHETVNIEHAEPQPSAEREGSPLDLVTA